VVILTISEGFQRSGSRKTGTLKIIVDTREQDEICFSKHDIVTGIIREKLDVGDYCVEYKNGYRPPVIFERKSIGDLYSSLFKNYARFRKEVQRAHKKNIMLILAVEGTYTKVGKGYKYSKVKGESMRKKLNTMWYRYNLFPIFCKDRAEMARRIVDLYSALGRGKVWANPDILDVS